MEHYLKIYTTAPFHTIPNSSSITTVTLDADAIYAVKKALLNKPRNQTTF
jgi:hypothetical protein